MATRRGLAELLKAGRLRITQNAKSTTHTSQVVNVNFLVDTDSTLKRLTSELLDQSEQPRTGFQTITEFLRNIDARTLDPLEQDLVTIWLRKVVAANHINFAKRFAGRSSFQLVMFDTSLYDQPVGSWLENSDFRRVVDFDGQLARVMHRKGNPHAVLRLFFVPDSTFLTERLSYILETIRDQVSKGISCAIGRADYLELKDSRFVCDLFMVRDHLVCAIEKPFWQFNLVDDASRVREYFDMLDAILKTDFVLLFDERNKQDIGTMLRELATL